MKTFLKTTKTKQNCQPQQDSGKKSLARVADKLKKDDCRLAIPCEMSRH